MRAQLVRESRGRRSRGLWRAFQLLTLLICLGCGKGALRSPAEGGRSVYQVQSAHFVVHSDESGERATELARELERRYLALELVAFLYEPPFKRRTEVVEFSEWKDLHGLGIDFHGLHTDAWEWHTGMTTMLLAGKEEEAAALIATHELTHAFVAHHLPGAPIWLNEGLAKYCETLAFEGDKAVFGYHLVEYAQNSQRTVMLDVDPTSVLSISALAGLSSEQFYARPSVHYASAWSTVHALYSPGHRAAFEAYLDLLHTGEVAPDQAFATAFAGINEAELVQQARQTVEDIGLDLRRVAIPRVAESDFGAPRRLTDVEVLTFYARVVTSSSLSQGLELARRAVARAPEDPEALVVAGSLELIVTQRTGIERVIEGYQAAAPDRRAPYAAAVLRWADLGAQVDPTLADRMARDLVSGARTPQEVEALSRYLLRRGRLRAAQKYAVKALTLDPGRPSALETMASVAAALGEYGSAVKFQERAVNLRGHDAPATAAQLLREYRKKAGLPSAR